MPYIPKDKHESVLKPATQLGSVGREIIDLSSNPILKKSGDGSVFWDNKSGNVANGFNNMLLSYNSTADTNTNSVVIIAGNDHFVSSGGSITIIGGSGNTVTLDSGYTGHSVFIGISNFTGNPQSNTLYTPNIILDSGGTINNVQISAITSSGSFWETGFNNTSIVRSGAGNSSFGPYSPWSAVLAGKNNHISGSSASSVIVGGSNNVINNVPNPPANFSSIMGGYLNFIKGGSTYSTIIGGRSNKIDNSYSSGIIAGKNNFISQVSQYSFIAGGQQNKISGTYSSILGGKGNSASTIYSSVVGGVGNLSIGANSTILGGANNKVSGAYSSILGGTNYTLSQSNTSLVPKLLIANLPTGSTIFALNADASGNVKKKQEETGLVSSSSFTGVSLSFDIVFTTTFADTDYAVMIMGEDARTWSYSNKTASGFRIETNSITSLTGEVSYIAKHN